MALIPDMISNSTARIMRMQFWKDVVEDCFKGKERRGEPVSELLTNVIKQERMRLTKSFFMSMVSERVRSLALLLP
jgi:hypothetical protein